MIERASGVRFHHISLMRWIALAVLLIALPARADNDDGVPVGMEAAQSGSAITATISAGAAGFYNPAGVAAGENDAVDVSANAYGLRIYRAAEPVFGPQGEASAVRVVDWMIAPTLLSYTRRFSSRWYGSFGLFVPRTSDFNMRARLLTNEGTQWFVALDSRHTTYYAGFSAGVRVTPRLRIGVSLLGVYDADSESLTDVAGGPGVRTASLALFISSYSYALNARAGVQWDVDERWSLGLALWAPEFRVGQRVNNTAAVTAPEDIATQGGNFGILRDSQRGVERVLSGMPQLRGGVAYKHSRGWIALDGTLSFPQKGDALNDARELDFNARLGTVYDLTRVWRFGAGLFSDRYLEAGDGLDFYGLTFGGSHDREYELRDGRVLRFVTSVNARYAYGTGKVTGTTVPSILPGSEFNFQQHHGPAHSSELSISIGSGVSF